MNFICDASLKFNIPSIKFGLKGFEPPHVVNPSKDGFVTNPLLDKFGTKAEIELSIRSNPKILDILKTNNLPLQINMEELEKLKQGHLMSTRVTVAQIYSALPEELKKDVNIVNLQEAAIFHDYGKVLIPSEILNKSGKLNPRERQIMELHAQLGYELLKDKGLSDRTLELIKYHHQNLKRTGYPSLAENDVIGLDSQILNVADKYTALREKRSYKNPLGKYEAFEIIAKDVNLGLLSQEVYTALIKSV